MSRTCASSGAGTSRKNCVAEHLACSSRIAMRDDRRRHAAARSLRPGLREPFEVTISFLQRQCRQAANQRDKRTTLHVIELHLLPSQHGSIADWRGSVRLAALREFDPPYVSSGISLGHLPHARVGSAYPSTLSVIAD